MKAVDGSSFLAARRSRWCAPAASGAALGVAQIAANLRAHLCAAGITVQRERLLHLQAVIVSPDVGHARGLRGYYAYPFFGYGYGWNPGLSTYNLPYGKAEISDLTPFAYDKK